MAPRENGFNQSEKACCCCARAHGDVFQARLQCQGIVQLYKGSIFVIQSQVTYYKRPNSTERLHVDATIMRCFQAELFSRFLPSSYAAHVNLDRAKH